MGLSGLNPIVVLCSHQFVIMKRINQPIYIFRSSDYSGRSYRRRSCWLCYKISLLGYSLYIANESRLNLPQDLCRWTLLNYRRLYSLLSWKTSVGFNCRPSAWCTGPNSKLFQHTKTHWYLSLHDRAHKRTIVVLSAVIILFTSPFRLNGPAPFYIYSHMVVWRNWANWQNNERIMLE